MFGGVTVFVVADHVFVLFTVEFYSDEIVAVN